MCCKMEYILHRCCIFLFALSCVVLKTAIASKNYPSCPTKFCVCKPKSTARCIYHRKDLYYIPTLPSSVKKLIFVGNFLPKLNRSTFLNISITNSITYLNLSSNGIKFITSDAFTDFKSLYSVDLSFNIDMNLDELRKSFQSMRFSLDGELHLQNVFKNNTIPRNFFGNFTKTKLGKMFLQQNKLIRVNGREFSKFLHLNTLDVSNNEIISVDLHGLKKLTYLNLDHNNLGRVPPFCFSNGSSLTRKLRVLSLKNNKIKYLQSDDFVCVSKVKFLYLVDNPLKIIHDNVFASLIYLEKLNLKTSRRSLKEIKRFAFNSSSLGYLNLADVNFRFTRGSFHPNTIFRYCSQLYTLDLSNNYVPFDSNTTIKMFGWLYNLRNLVLQHVYWMFIPGNLFYRLRSLKRLDLSNNMIFSLTLNNPFQNMKGLSYLGLAANKLDTLSEHFLPDNVLDDLKTLNLAFNPFTCDCNLIWFVNWLNKTKIRMLQYPREYYCVMPTEWKSKQLNTFHKDCSPESHHLLKSILIASCSSFVFICIIILTLYKMRWHIRYWIYLIRTKGNDYTRFHDTGYMYEGFVVYCESDRTWVHDKLVPYLEEEHGFKLCIHYRDFQVGKLIVDNIVECMEQSRKIILVLSNAFAKSEWCQFEVLLAHKRFMANETGNLVVVLLEEVNSSHFTNALKIVLTSTTYAIWSENQSGQILFWNQILSAFESSQRPDYDRINA